MAVPCPLKETTILNTKNQYTQGFREQALEKAYSRGSRSVKSVSDELHMSVWTLKSWMKTDNNNRPVNSAGERARRPADWSSSERLALLMESHGLKDEELHAWCRQKGIFAHHLRQWQAEFEAGGASPKGNGGTELRELKVAHRALERELKRKEKALAEAAALLVLQKKYQALWEDKDV